VRSHKFTIIVTCMLVAFICGCATVSGDWERASSMGTVDAYQNFLAQHPESEQAPSAQRRIAWKQVVATGAGADLGAFASKYPGTREAFIAQAWSSLSAGMSLKRAEEVLGTSSRITFNYEFNSVINSSGTQEQFSGKITWYDAYFVLIFAAKGSLTSGESLVTWQLR
jgi:hypothetical protein